VRATRMRDGVRARSPEARAHDGEEGWGEGFVAREPHTERDYHAVFGLWCGPLAAGLPLVYKEA